MLWSEINAKARELPDDRPLAQRVKDSDRKPATPKPMGPVEAALQQMERAKADRKLMKMSKEDRSAHFYRQYLDSEEPQKPQPHVNQARVKGLIENIVTDPLRQRSAFDLAMLVYESYAVGMDHEAADILFGELLTQEKAHLEGVRQQGLAKREALQAELDRIDAAMKGFDPPPTAAVSPEAFSKLHRLTQPNSGVLLSPEAHGEITSAAGNPEAEATVAAKYAGLVGEA